MNYPKYSNYKDSKNEWLGRIPHHWAPKRLKFVTSKIVDGTHFTPEYIEEGIPFLRVTDISGGSGVIDFEKVKRISEKEHLELNIRCNPEFGDLLLSKNGTIGVPCIVNWDIPFSIFVSLCLIKPKTEIDVRFLKYIFLSKEIEEQINAGGKTNTITNLHLDKIKEFFLSLPPIDEQQSIADFLDKEVSRIDTLIAKKQESIERLKEKRLAVISNAVTKGIDPKVEMKASGVDWLEDIPKSWNVKPIKYFCTVNDETLSESSDPTAEILYVDIGSVDPTKGIVKKDLLAFEDAPSRARRIVKSGDIIVSTVRTYLGAIAPIENAEENLIVSTGFAVIRPKQIEADFLSFFLRSKYFVEAIVSRSVGVSYPAINASVLASIKIASPSSKIEQKEIAEYLEKETSKMDLLMEKTELHIDKLQEYKTALISAAVTGKIKVTDQV